MTGLNMVADMAVDIFALCQIYIYMWLYFSLCMFLFFFLLLSKNAIMLDCCSFRRSNRNNQLCTSPLKKKTLRECNKIYIYLEPHFNYRPTEFVSISIFIIITAIHLLKGVKWNVSICLKLLIYFLFVRLSQGFENLQEKQ